MGETAQTIRHELINSTRTDRTWGFYLDVFAYSADNLRGKNILDIGAGDSNFAEKAREWGARIIKIDADYSNIPPEINFDSLTGLAQYLPFKDNTFDEVIASFSLFWIFTGQTQALLEMIRVTKPDGKIKICPAEPRNSREFFRHILPVPVILLESTNPFFGNHERTLVIQKLPTITLDEWPGIIEEIASLINIDYNTLVRGDAKNPRIPKKLRPLE